MKKLTSLLTLLILAIVAVPTALRAQQMPSMGVDPQVRIGKLANGMTYYIRHNEYPKGQADFYIAQKVGSVLEEDNQRGLAHFLEHMCFNGTTNYPGKNLINYLESIGVKFGANLNAVTGTDMTLYNISNVPTARKGVQDSCLLILHDWANDLLLLPEEIDAERAVIHEEWRKNNVGQMRILENLLPVIYPDSRYGYRLPIGTMDVVDNFAPQALRDYYEKWYRPDLQGLIIVGDIDVDYIEEQIKKMFSDIEMPENPAERIYFPVPDTDGTIYAIGHDKEQTVAICQFMFKTDILPMEMRNSPAYYMQRFMNYMVSSMLNTRLNDIYSKPDAPFAYAGVNIGNYILAETKDALTLISVGKSGAELPKANAAAYRELLRAAKGGFTTAEFDRAKSEFLSNQETAFNNRNQRQNDAYVNLYVNNFLENAPIPAMEESYEMVKMLAGAIDLNAINGYLSELVTPNNRVLLALMPDTQDNVYPTEEDFASAIQAVDGEELEEFKEEIKTEPLIEKMPRPGKITKTTKLTQWGATQWTLSNGAKVIVKPTKFKDAEIMFAAYSPKGTYSVPASKNNSLAFMREIMTECGLGTYSNSDLQKYLAGKKAMVIPSAGSFESTVSGFTTPKDLPTLMELIYMTFTAPNFTDEEFAALQRQNADLIHNQESNPQHVFQTKIYETLYPENLRQRPLTVDNINGASRDEIVTIARSLTENAADFTFVFVGSIDIDALRPLVEQYIASLPGNPKKTYKAPAKYPADYQMARGTGVSTYTTPMLTPQTWCYITAFGETPYTLKNAQIASIAGQILSKRLVDIVREKEGATYSLGAQGSMDRGSDPLNTQILTAFPMKPEMKDKVLGIIADQIVDMASNIDQAELDKVKEYMVKNAREGKEKNGSWLSAISGWVTNGVDTFNGNVESIGTITTADIMDFMRALNAQGNYRAIILDPTETQE